MRFPKILSAIIVTSAGGLIGSAAGAQQPAAASATPVPGMAVKDASGGDVGIVQSVKGDIVVLKTDRHEVQIPRSSFAPHEGHLLLGATRAELNAQVDQALANAAAQIKEGAAVHGKGGSVVATIQAVGSDNVTLKLPSGDLVRFPKNGIAPGPNGIMIGMTAAELQAAAGS